jgi:hypothetical protein
MRQEVSSTTFSFSHQKRLSFLSDGWQSSYLETPGGLIPIHPQTNHLHQNPGHILAAQRAGPDSYPHNLQSFALPFSRSPSLGTDIHHDLRRIYIACRLIRSSLLFLSMIASLFWCGRCHLIPFDILTWFHLHLISD